MQKSLASFVQKMEEIDSCGTSQKLAFTHIFNRQQDLE